MAAKKNSPMKRLSAESGSALQEKPPEGPPSGATQNATCPIVGVGASAGGLEAFSEMLANLPSDAGMTLVLVQHLDPHHQSLLSELLGRTTPMSVEEIKDGVIPQPNHVYVIPANRTLLITDGALRLEARPPGTTQMPIDIFFRSLAAWERSKAIGVILSGTASDGTLGLKAIKAEGGITFCQEPGSAKYDGMPRSAIASGSVDYILSPREIARELVRLCRHPYVVEAPPKPEGAVLEPDYKEIFTLLRTVTGVDFTFYKHATIQRRIQRRMALSRMEDPRKYLAYIRFGAREKLPTSARQK
jgi:two-component system CheB/CheR fusion protein